MRCGFLTAVATSFPALLPLAAQFYQLKGIICWLRLSTRQPGEQLRGGVAARHACCA